MASGVSSNRFRLALFLGVPLLAAVVALLVSSRLRGPEPVTPLAELVRVNGLYAFRNDTNRLYSGWVTEQYAGGAPRSKTHVADGRLDGISEGWHTNGVLQVRESFVAGVSEGPVTKWHANGNKLSEGVSHAGKLEGVFRRWHDNGTLAEEITMVGGAPEGLSRAWFPNGQLKAEVTLQAGKVLAQKFWKEGERPADTAVASTGGSQ